MTAGCPAAASHTVGRLGLHSGASDGAGSRKNGRHRERNGVATMERTQNSLRILAVMAVGLPGVLPEVWRVYARLEEARVAALNVLRDPRVRGVAILDDHNGPLSLVEWMAPSDQAAGRRPSVCVSVTDAHTTRS